MQRKYLLDDGRQLTTLELPETVVKALGKERVHRYMKVWQRGEALRAAANARRQRVAEMLGQGISTASIAAEVGCTRVRVRQIELELTQGKEKRHERKRIKPTPIQREPRELQRSVECDIRTRWAGGRSPFGG